MTELNLHGMISKYHKISKQIKELEEVKNDLNAKIKMEMQNREVSEFKAQDGKLATITREQRQSINMESLIKYLQNNYSSSVTSAVIEMTPVVNETILAELIQKGEVDPKAILENTETKEIIRLTVKDEDKKSKPFARTDDWGWGDK